MRTQFILTSDTPYADGQDSADTIAQAKEIAPWAAEIVEVEGGYLAFESVTDFETWQRQQ